MITYVDASVIVAILNEEDDCIEQAIRLQDVDYPICSAVSIWEATVAVARNLKQPVAVAFKLVTELMTLANVVLVEIGEREAALAIAAFDDFGKGRHKARLNMGDCFTYACAKTNGAKLLYKGDDFIHTDLA